MDEFKAEIDKKTSNKKRADSPQTRAENTEYDDNNI